MDKQIKTRKCQTLEQLGHIRACISQAPLKQRAVLTNIGMLCTSGVHSHHVVRTLPVLLRQLIEIDIAGFFWANQLGDMIDAYVETPYFLSADVLLSCMKFQSEAKGNWPSFTENVMQGPVVGYLQKYQTPHFYASEHFAFTYARIGMHHITDAVVHNGKRPFGAFLFMRSQAKQAFTVEEIATLKIAMALMPDSFLLPPSHSVLTKRTYDVGMIVVDRALKRTFNNLTAHQMLWMMTRDVNTPMRFDSNDDIDSLIRVICTFGVNQAFQVGRHQETKKSHWGECFIQYTHDAENKAVAVSMQLLQPYSCHVALRLNLEKLSPIRLMTTWLLLEGYVRKEIASKLQISDHTCADHIQAVFNHFNVNSVNELILNIYQ